MEEEKLPRNAETAAPASQPVTSTVAEPVPPPPQTQVQTPPKPSPQLPYLTQPSDKAGRMCSPGKRMGKPRLMIERLELENFKSYAGLKVIGPFHKYFTSVVGPNGSGKSNLIDSLMFVFGKRSKKLRIHKLTDVIHKSSGARELKFARVSVYFQEIVDTGDGDDDYRILEGSKFVVSHEVRKSGESFYKIDGAKRTFDDVCALLKTKGIDLDYNRFLLLQGEVESISLMKPKGTTPGEVGLLEYLEDVIGTDRYKEAIEQREKLIETKEEEKVQEENRFKDVRKQVQELEEPKNKAIEYIKKEKMRFAGDNLLQQIQRFEITQELSGKEKRRQELEETRSKAEEEKRTKLSENQEFQHVLQEISEAVQKTNATLEKTAKEYAGIEKRYEEGSQETRRLHELQVKLEEQLKKRKKEHSNMVQGRAQTEKAIPQLEGELDELKKRCEELDGKLKEKEKEVNERIGAFKKQREEVEGELVPAKRRHEEMKRKLEAITAEVANMEGAEKQNEESRQTLGVKIEELKKEAESKKEALVTLEAKYTKHTSDLEEAKKNDVGLGEEEKTLVQRIQERAGKLQGMKALAQENQTKSYLLRELFKAQDVNQLHGIIGRLGDMGTIEEKYDVAVTNACAQLDSVVVQSKDQASAVIEFMKEHRLGRAHITIMDVVVQNFKDDRASFRLPTAVHCERLVDLIKPKKPEYRAAFYSVLRDTLLVESLDDATKLMNYGGKRSRVVTIKGEVIEVSGTMSGGGRPRRGGMAAVARGDDEASPEQIRTLEGELEMDKERLKELKEKQAIHRGLVASAETQLTNMETKRGMLKMEVQSLEKQLNELGGKLAALEELSSRSRGQTNSVEYVAGLKREAEKLGAEIGPLVRVTRGIVV